MTCLPNTYAAYLAVLLALLLEYLALPAKLVRPVGRLNPYDAGVYESRKNVADVEDQQSR